MAYECCVCGIELGTVSPTKYFCSKCYNAWQSEILAGAEWIRYLVNNEQQRRSYGSYSKDGEVRRVSFLRRLGEEYDLVRISGSYKVIPIKRRGEN
jgi:hypothetical protein